MLPLSDLLSVLRERGLPIGVHEHLTVGRLLERWQSVDSAGLRAALAAVLARNSAEVRLVRETFDELYGPRQKSVRPPPPAHLRRPPRRRWGRMAGLILAFSLIANSLAKEKLTQVVVPQTVTAKPAPKNEPPDLIGKTGPQEEPPISETFEQVNWKSALEVAAGLALLILLWLNGTRLQREACGLARRLWCRELDSLPRPYAYELTLGRLAPAFPAAVLDLAARLLGRAPAAARPDDLNIDRSLERTLHAGLAPQIVFQERSSPLELLVLQDISGEMRPWRRPVNALLAGLSARGVRLDIWHYHADASIVFRSPGRHAVSLERLASLRVGSPLLVISTGEGLPTGREGRLASWIANLNAWQSRAWLHPVTDASYWRPQLRQVATKVWPLTPGGVIAAAHHLAAVKASPRTQYSVFPDRPVVPLDVDRMRWLLSLAPRRDPDLIELLRQKFFPRMPPAALLETLEAAPLPDQLGSLPQPVEIHTFLADLLAATPPESGSAAHERWLLDRALQEVHIPSRRDEGLDRLQTLASGPLVGEVETAAGRLSGKRLQKLRKAIYKRAVEDGLAAATLKGRRRRLRWPDRFELSAAFLCALLFVWGFSRWLVDPQAVELIRLYNLEVINQDGRGPVVLRVTRRPRAPVIADLYRQNQKLKSLVLQGDFTIERASRGNWYYLWAWTGADHHRLAASNSVWVRAKGGQVEAAVPGGVMPPATKPRPVDTPSKAEPGPTEPLSDRNLVGPAPVPSFSSASSPMPPFGTLTILGYPEDLPPQLLHISGGLGMPSEGILWNGEALKLAPGDYLLVVHTPLRSLALAEVTIQDGSAARIKIAEEKIGAVRQSLVKSTPGGTGPRITEVTPDFQIHMLTIGARVAPKGNYSIQGDHFDASAKVSFYPLPDGLYLDHCQIQPEEIQCEFFIEHPLPRQWGAPDFIEVKVVNPDGRYAVSTVYLGSSR